MAKLDWLNENNYLEEEIGREYRWCAWLLWGIALVILLIPVRGSALNLYYIQTADNSPAIIGHVIRLQPSSHRGIHGGKGGHYEAKIDIEYRGKAYYVTNVGFNFTQSMYEEACKTGLVPVYLNRERPEKSVLSKGVPFVQYFSLALFSAVAMGLIIAGTWLMRRIRLSNRN